MSEMSFEQMLDESIKSIHNGEVVEGTVIDVKDDQIILNIGYKADGILTKQEYSNDPDVKLTEAVQPGQTMEVKVLRVNDGDGQVLLSYKRLMADRGNKALEAAFENGDILTGTVTQALSGGLSVTAEGSRVFIPASLVSDVFEHDLKICWKRDPVQDHRVRSEKTSYHR
jgi:ribosomal protein S1